MKNFLLVLTGMFAVVTIAMGIFALTAHQGIIGLTLVILLATVACLTLLLVVCQKETAHK